MADDLLAIAHRYLSHEDRCVRELAVFVSSTIFVRAVGDFGQGPIDDECPRPEVGSWTEANRLVLEGRS